MSKDQFCPDCGEMLNHQKGFSDTCLDWECEECEAELHRDHTWEDFEVVESGDSPISDKRLILLVIVCLLLVASIVSVAVITNNNAEKIAISQGKINAGVYTDLVGMDYQSVEAHFRATGFTNIELVHLDDPGIGGWKDGKVKTISIGGNMKFDSEDWFDPDTWVIISYN